MRSKDIVYDLFIVGKIVPEASFNPKGIACEAQTFEATVQCLLLLLNPPLQDAVCVKRSTFEVPLRIGKNDKLPAFNKPIDVGDCLLERRGSLLYPQRLGCYPHARFVASQTLSEVGHQNVTQIALRFVELTKVCSPRYIADKIHSKLLLGGHVRNP